MGLWAKSVVIFSAIREHGKQSIRSLAERTGLSKSSVQRHLQAMDRRDRYPESSFWETEAGRAWLIRLVVATLLVFGLKRGVGAETLSEFFGRLRLEAHVGCSPSALRWVMHTLERLLLKTAGAWETEGIAHGEIRPVIGAVDETFLQRMMLVFMDLATGYLLMEEVSADRSFAAWFDRANKRLTTFGTEVLYLVSDRAKALIKLAHTGLGCPSIPDLFHLGHDLAKGYSLCIFGRLRQAKRDLEQVKQRLEKLQKNTQAERVEIEQAQALVAACACSVNHWQEVGSAWRQRLANVSRILHPWRLADSTRQTSKEVEEQLCAELEAIATLLATNGLPMKKATLDKARKQLAGISALVDLWWQTVRQDLTQLAMTPRWTQWAEDVLLPLMYWQEQLRRTRCPGQKAQMALALQAVEEAFERHPCTRQLKAEVLAGWKAWAADHAKAFQRASSAVEGRHGYLSQMQHNHRGLPTRRYQVWTVRHNFDCWAANGTTPASRFFRRSFPDLFESVLSQIDELPMPRQRRQAIAASN
jgi:DNA-binding transcriptional ArsR family regulator/tellurite resistance protein